MILIEDLGEILSRFALLTVTIILWIVIGFLVIQILVFVVVTNLVIGGARFFCYLCSSFFMPGKEERNEK